ncbi:hypothetical protein [Cohnella terricola]|uniref:Knr4/Smi1-like domain-containing protein n=1 Tax=Cohnella terricola TaxID=1289167 RepID=A0A559JQA0_9BACL|nr:hypothetical protein [Cohnella terricola]TVY02066.1 hypothetical protein FPZ45_06385 [Cohnella terricola]
MNTLEESILQFIQSYTQSKQPFEFFIKEGEIVHQPNLPKDLIDVRIPLSNELKYLYENFRIHGPVREDNHQLDGVDIDLGNNVLYLYAPDRLLKRQSGYRWIDKEGQYDEDPSWNPHWIVIADIDSNPIVVDSSLTNSPVFASYEGGELFSVSDSLARFFDALSVVLQVSHAFNGEIIDDETFEVKSEYVDQLEKRLEILLGKDHTDNLLDYLSIREK